MEPPHFEPCPNCDHGHVAFVPCAYCDGLGIIGDFDIRKVQIDLNSAPDDPVKQYLYVREYLTMMGYLDNCENPLFSELDRETQKITFSFTIPQQGDPPVYNPPALEMEDD